MSAAIKLSLFAAGLFLLFGMLSGVVKYQRIMSSPNHSAGTYVDIAHRSSFLYSFASLVMAKLLEYSPYSRSLQLLIVAVPLSFFALTISGYFFVGITNRTDNIFSERNLITTWFMYLLIIGELGGMAAILWGFVSTQLLS